MFVAMETASKPVKQNMGQLTAGGFERLKVQWLRISSPLLVDPVSSSLCNKLYSFASGVISTVVDTGRCNESVTLNQSPVARTSLEPTTLGGPESTAGSA